MGFDEMVVYIISFVAGLTGVPVVQLLKKYTGWKNEQALLASVLASVALGIASVFLNGAFTGSEVTIDNLSAAVTMVFSVATIFYKAIVADKKQE